MFSALPLQHLVSYHHPLEEGLGRMAGRLPERIREVSYHHPLEEGLGHL